MSIANDIINNVKKKHGVTEEAVREIKNEIAEAAFTSEENELELLKKYGYNSKEEMLTADARAAAQDAEAVSGGLPALAIDSGREVGGMPPVKFENVGGYVEPTVSTAPKDVPFVNEVQAAFVSDGSADGEWGLWKNSKQGLTLCDIHNMNMSRLHAIIPDRIEAAFRAGYAAGRQGND